MTSGGWGLCRQTYTNRMVGRPRAVPGLTVSDVDETILVQERGQLLEFSYTDMLCYAGPYSPAGVATAFKVMQRAFAALSGNQPPQRRSIVIRTAFAGPGAALKPSPELSPMAATRWTPPWRGPTAAGCCKTSSSRSPSRPARRR